MLQEKYRRRFPLFLTLLVGVAALVGGKIGSDAQNQKEIEEFLAKNQPVIAEGQDSFFMEGLLPERPFTTVIEEASDVILIGEVVKIDIPYAKPRGQVYHNVYIHPEKVLKNEGESVGEEVIVEVYGGELNGAIHWTSDAPSFSVGERVFVFLTEGVDAPYHVTYGAFGKLMIENGMVEGINEEDGLVNMSLEKYQKKVERILQK